MKLYTVASYWQLYYLQSALYIWI